MKNQVNAFLAAAALACLVPAAALALTAYSQDFETLDQSDPGALAGDGWLVYGNVFGPDWGYWYGYGVFPAPNDGAAFCAIVAGEGGGAQGMQQMAVFSDYNNVDHANGAHIEALVFQEQLIGPGQTEETWVFDFQAKRGNLEGESTAKAFIKTLDPNNGYATTNFVFIDMTDAPQTWTDYSLSLAIGPSLDNQLVQFGFLSVATNYEGSGIFYDNLTFHLQTVATEATTWGEVKTLFQ